MTTEEKAKAYDEAIKRGLDYIRQTPATEMVTRQDVFEAIFPEYAESVEERVRKEIIEYLTHRAEVTGFINENRDCKKWIAYLEKQKENPKSSDSIPSDCMSDAKCKSIWHKVEDSLPNSAREVLCKDAIGNFFIGRYYQKSQCWEVMMYDDCDKSNEDNPPVVKWCEIPSEKQKEQKPNILQNAFDKSKKDYPLEEKSKASDYAESILPTSIMYGESEEEYKLHTIIEAAFIAGQKEQKPTWSDEDEKMRNALWSLLKIQYAQDYSMTGVGIEAGKFRNWLNSLPKDSILQPKQGWSEEDEEIREEVIDDLCALKDWIIKYDTNWLVNPVLKNIDKRISWLKSLCPSWKPNEQEKGALKTAIHVLTEERSFPKTAEHLQAILDAFDGKETRKEWKPSEEQLEALKYVTKQWEDGKGVACPSSFKYHEITELYEQLKKLGVREEPEYYQHFDPDC